MWRQRRMKREKPPHGETNDVEHELYTTLTYIESRVYPSQLSRTINLFSELSAYFYHNNGSSSIATGLHLHLLDFASNEDSSLWNSASSIVEQRRKVVSPPSQRPGKAWKMSQRKTSKLRMYGNRFQRNYLINIDQNYRSFDDD